MTATLISGERSLAGPELDARVLRAAGGLQALGLAPGDVIGILMRNDFPVIELTFAAERAGLVPVPLNWHANADELLFICEDSGMRALFGHTDLLRPVADRVPASCRLFQVAPPPEVRQAHRLSPDACTPLEGVADYEDWLAGAPGHTGPTVPPPFRLLYTSGTTGRPKGVKRARGPQEVAERLGLRSRLAHGLEIRPIRALMPGPLYHSAPNVYALNCVRFGEVLVLQPKFDAQGLLELVTRHRLSHMHVVPTMFSRLLDLPQEVRDAFDPAVIRAVVHGAAMCPRELKQNMIDWWGPVILEYYAATETGIITASTSAQWLAHPGTVGTPPDGVEVRVQDDHGNLLPAGQQGEVFIRADVAALVSYHNRPDADAELHHDGWVTLGDIGYLDADGFLWLCDRKKDMVISGGVNIYPAELEDAAMQLDGVRDCAAFGIPDRDLGEALALYVLPGDGAAMDPEALRAAIAQRLGRLRSPKVVRFVPSLPREDSGKIARRKLKQHYLESLAQAG
jgi:long-chain acyl-CoA synthetase